MTCKRPATLEAKHFDNNGLLLLCYFVTASNEMEKKEVKKDLCTASVTNRKYQKVQRRMQKVFEERNFQKFPNIRGLKNLTD